MKKAKGKKKAQRHQRRADDRRKAVWGGRRSTDQLANAITPDLLQKISALADRLPAAAGKLMRDDAMETARRGRVAGVYIAERKNAAMRGVNETVTKIFKAIAGAGAQGITQKGIQEKLSLPHSTVWYALVKLRKRHAVNYSAVTA